MDTVDLISGGDFLLFFAYALFTYYILRVAVFRNMDKNFKRLFTVFFVLKAFCALLMTLLIVYYWGLSDNTAFYMESQNLVKLIKTDISNISYLFGGVDSYNEKIKLDNELSSTVSSLGIESNFLVVKITTLLYPIAFGRYLLINFFFSVIAAVGQFKFFIALSRRYPHLKKNIAVAVLLMPSVLLYSSYLNKETLCMAFIGFAAYALFQLLNKRKPVINSLILLLNILFIGIIKVYVLVAFLVAIVFIYLVKTIMHFWKGAILSKIFITILLVISLFFFFSNLDYFDSYVIDFADKSNTFQQQYNSLDATSSFEFGEIETSFSGLLKKAPLGIYTTYFRPHLWEVNKLVIFFSALESFLVFIITFGALIRKRKYIRQLLRTDVFANISLYYALIFGVIVGLTTFNFGSLVRYKIPAVPFLMMFVFLLLHYIPKKEEVKI